MPVTWNLAKAFPEPETGRMSVLARPRGMECPKVAGHPAATPEL